jgi:hypothetical protein
MSFLTIRTRLEDIVATITMPTNTVKRVQDGATPLHLDLPSGNYGFVVDLPSGNIIDEPTLGAQTDVQTWRIRCIAPEISATLDAIQQIETQMQNIGDKLIALFRDTKRLTLNNDALDGVQSTSLTNYQFTVQPYPARDSAQRYQFIMTLTIEYRRG